MEPFKANRTMYGTQPAASSELKNKIEMHLALLEHVLDFHQAMPEMKGDHPLDFMFDTNSKRNAKKLTDELKKLNYQVDFAPSRVTKGCYDVTGMTPPMKLEVETISSWIRQMCTIGHQCGCDFDGWGSPVTISK